MDEIPLDPSKTSISCSVTESQPLCIRTDQDSDEHFEKLSASQRSESEIEKSLNKETSKVVVDAEFEASMAPQSSSATEYIDDNKRQISDRTSFEQKEFETLIETERFGQQNAEPVQTSSYQANEELETTSVSDYSKQSTSTSVSCSELTPDNRQDFKALTRNLASEISSRLTELHSIVSKDILYSKPATAGATCGELAERKALQNLTKRLTKEILSKLKELCSAISEDILYTEPLTSAGESCNDPFTDIRQYYQASTRNLANEILSQLEELRSSVSEYTLFSKPSSAVGTLSDPSIRKELQSLTRNLANEILSKVEEYHSSKSEEIMYSETSTSAGTSCSNPVPDNVQDFQDSIRKLGNEILSKLEELRSSVSEYILFSKPSSAVGTLSDPAIRKELQALTRNLASEILRNLEELHSLKFEEIIYSEPSTSAGTSCNPVPDNGQDFQASVRKLGNQQEKLHSDVSEDELYYVDSTSAEVSRSDLAIRRTRKDSTKKLKNRISSKVSKGIRKPRFSCEHCDKYYTNKSKYKTHLQTHKGEGFKCQKCNNWFLTDLSLKMHIWRTHTGKELLSCTICDREYLKEYNLKQHLKKHAEIKTYQANEFLSKLEEFRLSLSEYILFSKHSSAVATRSDPALRKELQALTRNLANEMLNKLEELHSLKSEEILHSEPLTSSGANCSDLVPDTGPKLHSEVFEDKLYSVDSISAEVSPSVLAIRKAIQDSTKNPSALSKLYPEDSTSAEVSPSVLAIRKATKYPTKIKKRNIKQAK